MKNASYEGSDMPFSHQSQGNFAVLRWLPAKPPGRSSGCTRLFFRLQLLVATTWIGWKSTGVRAKGKQENDDVMMMSLIFEKPMDFTGHGPLIETTKWFLKDLESQLAYLIISHQNCWAQYKTTEKAWHGDLIPSFPDSLPSFLLHQYQQF